MMGVVKGDRSKEETISGAASKYRSIKDDRYDKGSIEIRSLVHKG